LRVGEAVTCVFCNLTMRIDVLPTHVADWSPSDGLRALRDRTNAELQLRPEGSPRSKSELCALLAGAQEASMNRWYVRFAIPGAFVGFCGGFVGGSVLPWLVLIGPVVGALAGVGTAWITRHRAIAAFLVMSVRVHKLDVSQLLAVCFEPEHAAMRAAVELAAARMEPRAMEALRHTTKHQ
jgi:hypothetical protein